MYKLTSDQYNKNERANFSLLPQESLGSMKTVMAATNGMEFVLVYVLYFLLSSQPPFYMSLCNLMFNGNNNKKNTVFQSNVY